MKLSGRPYCVALTGGLGAGKSTVAQAFAALGAGVVDTDAIAHALTAAGGAALPAIRAAFGPEVSTPDGALDRAAMRDRVFADAGARQRLEAILHPLIRAEASRQVEASTAPYVILVVPLLIEHLADYRPRLERILVVDCDPGLQVARAAARPGMDVARARAILAAQVPRATRLAAADDVLANHADRTALADAVARLHAGYLEAAAIWQKNLNNSLP